MNGTIWNSYEEAVIHLIFGAVSFFIHAYAMFINSAIFDYQNEKPKEEKSAFDVLIKDLMRTLFWIGYFIGHVQFISLFMPPVHSGVFS